MQVPPFLQGPPAQSLISAKAREVRTLYAHLGQRPEAGAGRRHGGASGPKLRVLS